MLPSIVCYADILGYRSLSRKALESGQGAPFLLRAHEALSEAHKLIRDRARAWDERRYLALQVFTDNIVVGYPIDLRDFGEPEMGHIFSIFAELQMSLATKGFFLRGGIAFGNHYMDRDVVFGDALLAAVALDKRGDPPRLALAESAVALVNRHLRFYYSADDSPQYRRLLRDADGVTFLDYLSEAFVNFPDAGVFFDLLEGHQKAIVEGLAEYRSSPDIRAKFEWAARYHNYVCGDFVESHPVPDLDGDPEYASGVSEARRTLGYLIDIESLAAHPSHIV